MEYNLKHFAYIGDSVWEVFIREIVITKTTIQNKMHKMSTGYVNAQFQADLINKLMKYLKEDEIDIQKRARNLKITVNKKNNPVIHSLATSFEAVIGYLYLTNKNRLNEIFDIIKNIIEEEK